MLSLGPIGFLTPWVLIGLVGLPALWFLLRAVPPAPVRERFPAVALLLGLKDGAAETDRTPWWLLALRLFAIGALILAFAGPVLNPKTSDVARSDADLPMLILLDGTWADAADWSVRLEIVQNALNEAQQRDRLVSVRLATLPLNQPLNFQPAAYWQPILAGLKPASFLPDVANIIPLIAANADGFETLWITSGIAFEGQSALVDALEAKGPVSVLDLQRSVSSLGPVRVTQTGVETRVHHLGELRDVMSVIARGPDPAGIERVLGEVQLLQDAFTGTTEQTAVAEIPLPSEVRNRVTRLEINGLRSAAAVQLAGNALRRPEVALISGENEQDGPLLLSSLHYLRAAFEPFADVIEADLTDVIAANPDMLVLADVARMSSVEQNLILDWTEKGGRLIRFAGPRLAASDLARAGDDPLMPVRLRAGGRTIGGAMSWAEPKSLQVFDEASPFFGLPIPDDVFVNAQIMAQPAPDLSSRVIASLSDGTPLVSRKSVGQGQVVLFHVTANADWSSLPLSGLYVSMLERLSGARPRGAQSDQILAEQRLVPVRLLDGFGQAFEASTQPAVSGDDVINLPPSIDAPAGLYQSPNTVVASNVFRDGDALSRAEWPNSVTLLDVNAPTQTPITPMLLLAVLAAFMFDIIASLAVIGRLRNAASLFAIGMVLALTPHGSEAQDLGRPQIDDAFALAAVADVSLAHVLTGDADVDALAHRGLIGLSRVLSSRSSVETAPPVGVDLATDPLTLFPVLYWPIRAGHDLPTPESYAKLNAYMRSGGMIVFDTADAVLAFGGTVTANGMQLQTIARNLDIPQISPVPQEHVLTRSFYLLDSFPGRYVEGDVWVEAGEPQSIDPQNDPSAQVFTQRLNDNVSPVIIGAQDWAAAWAIDEDGRALRPIGRGPSGERQRELAYRFGINLMMYVLTGNYKADQVHVPALLDRLGAQ